VRLQTEYQRQNDTANQWVRPGFELVESNDEGIVNKALITGNLILTSRGSGPIDFVRLKQAEHA
jgi:hypothetical protein